MKVKKTQYSGLLGMGVGGAALAYQFHEFGGHLEPIHWAFPAILVVLGVLYFLFGEQVTGRKEKEARREESKDPGS